MNTLRVPVDPWNPDPAVLREAAAVLRRGGLVAFPTETVYGLGANALNADAVRGIYRAKGRPSDNPLILHLARREEADRLARPTPRARRLISKLINFRSFSFADNIICLFYRILTR